MPPVQTSTLHTHSPVPPVQPSAPSSDQHLTPCPVLNQLCAPSSDQYFPMDIIPHSMHPQFTKVLQVLTSNSLQLGPVPQHLQSSPAPQPVHSGLPGTPAMALALEPSCRGCQKPGVPVCVSFLWSLWVIHRLSASSATNNLRTFLKAGGQGQWRSDLLAPWGKVRLTFFLMSAA